MLPKKLPPPARPVSSVPQSEMPPPSTPNLAPPLFPTSSGFPQPSELFNVPPSELLAPPKVESRLFFLPEFSKKYQDFTGPSSTLKELLHWIEKESKGVVFEPIRCEKWPDLRNGLRKEDVKKCVKPILRNFEAIFGKDHPLYPKLIDVFFQLYSLLLLDQKAETELSLRQVPTYLFGFHQSGAKTIMYPDQVVIAFNHRSDFFDLTYSKNLGRRSGFSVFRMPQDGGDFKNVFLAPDKTSQLDPGRFAFAMVDFSLIPPESRNIYIQNKLLALQDTINKQRRAPLVDIIGGVVLVRGIPSPEVLNWLIQRNVQEVPRFPDVEVVAWLDLDVFVPLKDGKKTFAAPYLITIKAASSFRWKKDNPDRITHYFSIFGHLFKKGPLTGSEKRELKRELNSKYSAAKELIKSNLKWLPAHEIFIKMAESIEDNQDFSQVFWSMVKEKEGHSGLPPIPLAKLVHGNDPIKKDEAIDLYIFEELKRFISWFVDMANDNPENVPPSVRVPLRKETSIKRLEKLTKKYGDGNLLLLTGLNFRLNLVK
ncbi:MAG: hypothetical protein V4591_09200 [Bdellovibrionota bacterium]